MLLQSVIEVALAGSSPHMPCCCEELRRGQAARPPPHCPRSLPLLAPSEMGPLTPRERDCGAEPGRKQSPITSRGAALLAKSSQSKGLALGFAVLKTASLLPQSSQGMVGDYI